MGFGKVARYSITTVGNVRASQAEVAVSSKLGTLEALVGNGDLGGNGVLAVPRVLDGQT
jgi:hypothetical protein